MSNLENVHGLISVELIEKEDVPYMPKEIVREGKAVKDGYMNSVDNQSFPAQGKEVFLRWKRRRWKIKGTTKGFYNTYNLIIKNSAVQSNINELEHRCLDRCPDKGYRNFKRYIGLGIISYNLHKIGKHLISIAREKEKLEVEALKAA